MLIPRDSKKEHELIQEIIESDSTFKKKHDIFLMEMDFKQQLIDARKSQGFTQKDVSRLSGLSQQAVSRLERSEGGTLDTLFRYLSSMGLSLTVR